MKKNDFFKTEKEKSEYLKIEKEIANVKENKNLSIWSIIKLIYKSILPNANN